MAILFMGGEELDFGRLYGNTFTTDNGTSGSFRPGYARAALAIRGDGDSSARGDFKQASSSFWFTGRVHMDATVWIASGWTTFLHFNNGTYKRLGFQINGTTRELRLVTWDNSGNPTTLFATSESFVQSINLHRIDVQVDYGVSGRVRFFFNQVPFLDFLGDNTSGGGTNLTSFSIRSVNNGSARTTYWSEMIVAERDTRTLSLRTHAPVATATGHEWLGSQADVGEIAADEATMITTEEADKEAKFTVAQLPAGNFAVRAFSVSAYAARGATGPSAIQLGVGSGGNDAFSADKALDTGWTHAGEIFETNPVTGNSWSINEINAIEITAKSRL